MVGGVVGGVCIVGNVVVVGGGGITVLRQSPAQVCVGKQFELVGQPLSFAGLPTIQAFNAAVSGGGDAVVAGGRIVGDEIPLWQKP